MKNSASMNDQVLSIEMNFKEECKKNSYSKENMILKF